MLPAEEGEGENEHGDGHAVEAGDGAGCIGPADEDGGEANAEDAKDEEKVGPQGIVHEGDLYLREGGEAKMLPKM